VQRKFKAHDFHPLLSPRFLYRNILGTTVNAKYRMWDNSADFRWLGLDNRQITFIQTKRGSMKGNGLDRALKLTGGLSFVSVVGYFLALHDIWHDYASPEVWTRAGQALPNWYSTVNRTPLEWGMLQLGFCFMLLFHVLLFIRLVRNSSRSTCS
jgi:hypothetical protein